MLVILKSMAPPLWSSPTGVFSWARIERRATTPLSVSAHLALIDADRAMQDSGRPTPALSPNVTAPVGITPRRPTDWPWYAKILGLTWLTGTLICASFVTLNFVLVSSRLRRSVVESDGALITRVIEFSRRLRVRRSVRIVVTSESVGPAVYGVIRPTLVLPQALLSAKPLDELEPILAHELIHVRRGDTFAAMLQLVGQCLWWFHPFVWWANRQACSERERACDEEVLAGLTCDPAAYGQGLLDIVRLKNKLRPMLAYPGVRSVEVTTRRLEHIMQSKPSFHARTSGWSWAIVLGTALVALPGAGFAVNPASHGSEPQQPATPNATVASEVQQNDVNFVVVPIRTELQRKLLGGDNSLKAYVELNGTAFLGKDDDELVQAIDPNALRRALVAVKGADKEARVVFTTMIESANQPHSALEPLGKALRRIATEAGFGVAGMNFRYAGKYDWQAKVAAGKAIGSVEDAADEGGVGDDLVKVYPVRTKVTRFLADVDCEVFFLKPLDSNDRPLISAELRESVKKAVAELTLRSKKKVSFNVELSYKTPEARQRNYEADTELIVGDGSGNGESHELADSLGFDDSSVTFINN